MTWRCGLLPGLGALVLCLPGEPATAAAVTAGGTLTVKLALEARLIAAYGDLDDALLDESVSRGPDLFNDTEVQIAVTGRDDASGLGYGGFVALKADTNVGENADESWLFLSREGWGVVRFGDDEGVASFGAGIVADEEGAALSAANVAAGTGGLDGDLLSDLFGVPTYEPLGTGQATKASLATAKRGGLNLALSYTPNLAEIGESEGNGDLLASREVAAGGVVEGILHYEGDFGEVGLLASLSGLHGDIKDEEEAGGDEYWAVQAGMVVELFDAGVGASWLREKVGALEVEAVTLGAGAELLEEEDGAGGMSLSVNYGRIVRSEALAVEDAELGAPHVVVVSADYGLMPGLVLQGDLARFDNDSKGEEGDGRGWLGVLALAVEF